MEHFFLFFDGIGYSLLASTALLLGIIYVVARKAAGVPRQLYPPVAGTVLDQFLNFGRLHDYHTEVSAKHKTFRLLAPLERRIFTVDPANVEYILKTNFANYGKGAFNYDNMHDLLGDGIFTVDGEKWRHQRKLASYEFSTKVLRDFSGSVFKRNATKLAQIVSSSSQCRQPMDIQDLFLRSTMDSIFKVGFGVELLSLDETDMKGVQFAKALDDSSVTTTSRYVDVLWRLKKFLNLGEEASMKKNIKVVDEFVYEIIDAKIDMMAKKESELDEKEDILSRFITESQRDPDNITRQYMRDIILNFLIAGKDTTAGTLAWFFYMMCTHPSIQEKVALEIKEATGLKNPDANFLDFAVSITDEVLNKMHYLHASLTETLRLYPAVSFDNKVCFSNDVLPDGHAVAKGDIVHYLPYAMGRMRFLWGDDAEMFIPERWLNEEGVFQPESPFKFTAFQAGPRICLGKEFSYRQMKIFAAVLLHFFKFKLSDKNKPVRYRTMLTLHVDGGLHVAALPR